MTSNIDVFRFMKEKKYLLICLKMGLKHNFFLTKNVLITNYFCLCVSQCGENDTMGNEGIFNTLTDKLTDKSFQNVMHKSSQVSQFLAKYLIDF